MYYDLKYSLEEVAYASSIHILSNLTYAMVLCEEFSVHCVFFLEHTGHSFMQLPLARNLTDNVCE